MIRLFRGQAASSSTGFPAFRRTTAGRVGHWSHIQHCGWSRAASVPDDIPNVQKCQKRLPKEERRALVVSYVNKYRESHGGRFPLLCDVQKEVGGSFYVIRSIFQELQYKSRMLPSTAAKENKLQTDIKKEDVSLTECESLSTEAVTVEVQTGILSGGDSIFESESCDSSDKLVEAPFKEVIDAKMKGHEADLDVMHSDLEADNKDASHAVVHESHVDTETDGFSHASNEKGSNHKSKHMDISYKVNDVKVNQANEISDPVGSKLDSHLVLEKPEDAGKKVRNDDPDSVASKSHTQESGMHGVSHANEKRWHDQKQDDKDFHHPVEDAKSHHAGQGNNTEPQKKSTLWGNFKSFAGSIINLWRKQ